MTARLYRLADYRRARASEISIVDAPAYDALIARLESFAKSMDEFTEILEGFANDLRSAGPRPAAAPGNPTRTEGETDDNP